MTTTDPLLDLVVDATEVDRERIAAALRGVIAIDKSGTVIPSRGFQELNAPQKVLAFLLGRKAAVLLSLSDDEAVGPTDLAAESGTPTGTMYPTVRRLANDRLISQDASGGYYLSAHQVSTAIAHLAERTSPEASERAPSPAPRRAAKRASKRAAPPAQAAARSGSGVQTKQQKAGNGFSTAGAVKSLIDQGFFDSPKSLNDVQRRLKDKGGWDIPVTTLSPAFTRLLRSGTLDRERNEQGTYEYVRPSKDQ